VCAKEKNPKLFNKLLKPGDARAADCEHLKLYRVFCFGQKSDKMYSMIRMKETYSK